MFTIPSVPFTLKPYQERMFQSIVDFINSSDPRGQVYAPTGAGKSFLFYAIIRHLIQTKDFVRICILHPTIALSQEQIKQCHKFFPNISYVSFHTGAPVRTAHGSSKLHSKSAEELQNHFKSTTNHHITFSTYHSFKDIKNIQFDLVIADEGHNVTKPCFFTSLENIKAKKLLFFTGTPLYDDGIYGMNVNSYYGNLVAHINPKDLIEENHIVPATPIIMKAIARNNGIPDIIDLISQTYHDQKSRNLKEGVDITKILVTVRGSQDIEYLIEHYNELNCPVDVYAITCTKIYKIITNTATNETTVSTCTGNGKKRMEYINEFNCTSKDAIILHIKILSEGIDIPSLTGTLLLRDVPKYKFLQIIGRCARPHGSKKHCYVTLPVVNGNHICGLNKKKWIKEFNEHGYHDLFDWRINNSKYLGQSTNDQNNDILPQTNIQVVDTVTYISKFIRQRYPEIQFDKIL